MESEREAVRPLTAEEVKIGVIHQITQTIGDAIYAKFGTSCNLHQRSYPKFRAKINIHLELDDFGLTTEDNHALTVVDGEVGVDAVGLDVDLEIPETPPNRFRKDTDQPITVVAEEAGRTVERKVKYKPRKKA